MLAAVSEKPPYLENSIKKPRAVVLHEACGFRKSGGTPLPL